MRMKHLRRGLAVLALVSLGLFAYATQVPRVSVSEFRSQVEREIPPGTPRTEVLAWLKARGYPAGEVGTRDNPHYGVWGEFPNRHLNIFGPTLLVFSMRFDEPGRRTDSLVVSELTYSL
jgi:hypothetical protein